MVGATIESCSIVRLTIGCRRDQCDGTAHPHLRGDDLRVAFRPLSGQSNCHRRPLWVRHSTFSLRAREPANPIAVVLTSFTSVPSGAYVSNFLIPLYEMGEVEDIGRRTGMAMTFAACGALAGPPISGAIYGQTGGYEAVAAETHFFFGCCYCRCMVR